MKKLFLALCLLFLAILSGLIVYTEFFADRSRRFSAKLAEVVPVKLDGWQVKDVPLAATDGMLEHVNKVLQFDDFVQRLYWKPGCEVIVYAAYWSPGKVTTADAGTHNPDSCWVNAGWMRTERRYAMPVTVGDRAMLPCEYGVYSHGKVTSNVMFWHLVQGVPQRYEDQKIGWRNGLAGRLERLPLVFADLKKYGLNQKREQLFVRISTNRPIAECLKDSDFNALLASLRGLGIFPESTSGLPTPPVSAK